MEVALVQDRSAGVARGCGCCIYCYIGAPLNCHRVRGEAEPAMGLETVAISMPMTPERCRWAGEQMAGFLKLSGLLEALGVGEEFHVGLGKYLFSIGLQGLLQQLVENAEIERRRLAEEGNREFDEVFGGGRIDQLDTEREC